MAEIFVANKQVENTKKSVRRSCSLIEQQPESTTS
jgi:hypothetical protein